MENTNTPNTQQTVVATKTVKKVRKVLVSKSVFYSIFIVIFALASFFMFCLDRNNFLRQKMPALHTLHHLSMRLQKLMRASILPSSILMVWYVSMSMFLYLPASRSWF